MLLDRYVEVIANTGLSRPFVRWRADYADTAPVHLAANGQFKGANQPIRPTVFRNLYPHWRNEYAAAMWETNFQDLLVRVEAAETADMSSNPLWQALRFSRGRIQDSLTGERSEYAEERVGCDRLVAESSLFRNGLPTFLIFGPRD